MKKKPVRKHCATVLGMCMFGYLALIIAIVYCVYGQYCILLFFSVVNRINFEKKRKRNKSNPKKQQQQKKEKNRANAQSKTIHSTK